MFSLNDCKFRNFHKKLIFVNSIICDVNICDWSMIYLHLQMAVILPFCEGFIFMIYKTLAKFSEFTLQIFESYFPHANLISRLLNYFQTTSLEYILITMEANPMNAVVSLWKSNSMNPFVSICEK